MPNPVRLDVQVDAAVVRFKEREGYLSKSEAIRQLIRRALKGEGLL